MKSSSSARTVAYPSDEFEEAVAGIVESLKEGNGRSFLFVGGAQEQKQDALSQVAAPGELNMHGFKVPNLIGERLTETQGNLRSAFDHADEQAAVLFFDEADMLLDRSEDDGRALAQTDEEREADQREDQESEALSDYFFDRVEAYSGVTVVCFSTPSYVRRLGERCPEVVVEL